MSREREREREIENPQFVLLRACVVVVWHSRDKVAACVFCGTAAYAFLLSRLSIRIRRSARRKKSDLGKLGGLMWPSLCSVFCTLCSCDVSSRTPYTMPSLHHDFEPSGGV